MHATPTTANIYFNVQPIIVAFAAWVVAGDVITAADAMCTALIMVGVALVSGMCNGLRKSCKQNHRSSMDDERRLRLLQATPNNDDGTAAPS